MIIRRKGNVHARSRVTYFRAPCHVFLERKLDITNLVWSWTLYTPMLWPGV